MEFTAPLEAEKTVTAGEDVTLECSVTQPDLSAEWRKDGSPIEVTERVKPTSVDTTHSLTIESATSEDSADYEVTIGDASSKITLTVDGRWTGYLYHNFTMKVHHAYN